MKSRFRVSFFVYALILLVLAACQGGAQVQTDEPTELAAVATLVPTIPTIEVEDTAIPPTVDIPPTLTAVPTITDTPTPGPSPTPSNTPTPSLTPSITPTSLPQFMPTLATWTPGWDIPADATPTATPPTAVPTAVATFEVPNSTTNVLLIGSDDIEMGGGVQRTDTMIIVSINRDTQTASMLSLPRDLYVFIPGWTMNRLNTAVSHGRAVSYPGGGIGLLKDTILYNFGIPIHYYAQVDFDGFEDIVDAIGGVDITTTCELTDWKLKSPELDPFDEDSWAEYTLPAGTHTLDGDDALWYVRSRLSTSDWDRGRRQQQVLRALLNQAVDFGLVSEVPTLYNTYSDAVETDLDIGRILQFASLAPTIRENGIQHLYLAGKTYSWTVPVTGAQVQIPLWYGDDMMEDTFQRLYLPPALTRATRDPLVVEIINGSGRPEMAALAAENLAWYGFIPVITDAEADLQLETELSYFGSNFKGAYEWLISWVAGVVRDDINLDGGTSQYNYQLTLGADYDPCLNQLYAPQQFLPTNDES